MNERPLTVELDQDPTEAFELISHLNEVIAEKRETAPAKAMAMSLPGCIEAISPIHGAILLYRLDTDTNDIHIPVFTLKENADEGTVFYPAVGLMPVEPPQLSHDEESICKEEIISLTVNTVLNEFTACCGEQLSAQLDTPDGLERGSLEWLVGDAVDIPTLAVLQAGLGEGYFNALMQAVSSQTELEIKTMKLHLNTLVSPAEIERLENTLSEISNLDTLSRLSIRQLLLGFLSNPE